MVKKICVTSLMNSPFGYFKSINIVGKHYFETENRKVKSMGKFENNNKSWLKKVSRLWDWDSLFLNVANPFLSNKSFMKIMRMHALSDSIRKDWVA